MANNRQYYTPSGWQQEVPIHHQQEDEANRQYYPASGWQQEIPIASYDEDEGYREGENSRGFQGYGNDSSNRRASQYETQAREEAERPSNDPPHRRRPQAPKRPPRDRPDPDTSTNVVNLREENENLKVLLRDVQQEKLSALDDFQPRSDADLKAEMVELQYQITSYSRFLRSSRANSDETRAALGDDNTLTTPADNISAAYFFESFLWKQLILELFSHPFKAFVWNGDTINETWCLIFDREGIHGLPRASEASERWKSITAKHLVEKTTQQDKEQQIKRINQVITDRFQYSAPALHGVLLKDRQFKKLVAKGWDVATTFAQQRCHLRLTFPEDAILVEDELVDVVEEVSHWRPFVFSVSPSLLKFGNGYGQDFDDRLCIVKAKIIGRN